jgi:2-amino-4-hydroxy-6-hydroxymethyldihydropteridine diphosphokinase
VTQVALGLGANLGDRLEALQAAIDVFARDPAVDLAAVSSVYETDPVGGPDQPQFLNAVLLIETSLSPVEVLALAHLAESELARVRDVRWGPRTLDVDILNYGQVERDEDVLTLPHPRAAQRGFVLVPLVEVAPDLQLAGQSQRVRELVEQLPSAEIGGVRRLDGVTLALADSGPTL